MNREMENNSKGRNKFMNAVSLRKNKVRENMNKFFMGVKKERSATTSVDTSSVIAANTKNPL